MLKGALEEARGGGGLEGGEKRRKGKEGEGQVRLDYVLEIGGG